MINMCDDCNKETSETALQICKSIGCGNTVAPDSDFCAFCLDPSAGIDARTNRQAMTGADPFGRDQHSPGAKLDAGKVKPTLIVRDMARAIWAVSAIGTFGANKYTPKGWLEVPAGQTRYADAGLRHELKRAMGEGVDPDSTMIHLAHRAWNAMAELDLYLREHPERLPMA